MIIRQLKTQKQLLKISSSHLFKNINSKSHFNMSSISQWVRKFMNRIRFEDNRAIQKTQDKISLQIIQTPKQLEQKFIGDEQFKSIVEKQRMQKIDEIIGTRTYFHQTKIYQQRIDSDHVMEIEELQKKHRQPKRQKLNWQNPQAPEQYKVKSSKKFYKNLKNLRQYPKHNYRITNFNDQKSQENIQFLGKQSLYTKLSLKWVDTYQKSLQNQTVQDISYELQSHRYSPLYVYFSPSYQSSKLYRISHQKYTSKLLTSVTSFTELQLHIEQVVSLEQIYNILKQHFHDERVNQWLRKVQNQQINYMLSGYKVNQQEDKLVVWIDLLGTKKQYVHLYRTLNKKHFNNQTNNNKKQNIQFNQSLNKQYNQSNKEIDRLFQSPNSITPIQNNIIFNCKPNTSFSPSGKFLYFVQRSEEGIFVELVSVPIKNNSLGRSQIIYKCKLYQELQICNDQGLGYIFLKLKGIDKDSNEKIMIIQQKLDGKGVNIIQVVVKNQQLQKQNQQKTDQPILKNKIVNKPSRLSVNTCTQGLILTQFYLTQNQYFKYGSSKEYATKVSLIPYKSHIQLSHISSARIQRQLQLSGSIKSEKKRPSGTELDFEKKQLLYKCPSEQFIIQISVRQSHVILSLSTKSIYSKKRLLFIPYQKSKNPHSLIFSSLDLSFINFGYCYNSQVVNFFINRSIIFNQYYQYTIWKKQLKQLTNDNVYIEKVKVGENTQLTVTVLNRYLQHLPKFFKEKLSPDQNQSQQINQYKLQNSQVPILIYFTDSKSVNNSNKNNSTNNTKKQVQLKKFLQKGTLVITITCRGTLSSDLINFYKGSGQNFNNMIQDLESAIGWIGNNLGSNISLYCKGPIAGLAGMVLNVKHPFLLTSTVLHDAVYELMDEDLIYQKLDYFIKYENHDKRGNQFIKYWKQWNPARFSFKKSKMLTKKILEQQARQKQQQQFKNEQKQQQNKQLQKSISQTKQVIVSDPPKLGTLQNILLSCSSYQFQKNQARRMIYYLRSNINKKYEQVYLKQFLQGEDEELFNLAYIYGKMKQRLEEEHKL